VVTALIYVLLIADHRISGTVAAIIQLTAEYVMTVLIAKACSAYVDVRLRQHRSDPGVYTKSQCISHYGMARMQ
jgi:hypothetical protein